MKKILSIILVCCLLLISVPFTASAAVDTSVVGEITSGTTGDCTWTLDGTTLTISGSGAMDDYEVTGIFSGSSAPWSSSSIKTVVIEEGVTYVGNSSFYGCTGITKAYLSDSIESFGTTVFASLYTGNLKAYVGDDTPALTFVKDKSISYKLIRGTTGNCRWSLNGTVLTIGGGTDTGSYFGYSPAGHEFAPWGKDITELIVEEGVQYLSDNNFIESKKLTSVSLPSTLRQVFQYTFQDCTALTQIAIPDSVTVIGIGAFSGCTSLTTLKLPDSSCYIRDRAFSNCTSLASVTVPSKTIKLYDDAFKGCSSLKDAYIMGSGTQFGSDVFLNCNSELVIHGYKGSYSYSYATSAGITFKPFPGVTGDCVYEIDGTKVTIYGSGAMGNYTSSNKAPWGTDITEAVLAEGVTNIGDNAFYNCKSLTKLTVPSTVTTVGKWALNSCENVNNFTLPNSVTSIGEFAFSNCASWAQVSLPSSVETVGAQAFTGCMQLTSLTIPASLHSLKNDQFANCYYLQSVHIPATLTEFSGSVFRNCNRVSSITVDPQNPVYDSRNNCNAVIETSTNRLLKACDNTVLFDGITSVGDAAFSGCNGKYSIVLPGSVTKIERWAFYGAGFKEIVLPTSVTAIEDQAFIRCSSLQKISVPASAENLSTGLFDSAPNVTIYGFENSKIAQFASVKNIPFKLLGDTNSDNKLSISDVTAIQRQLAELEDTPDGFAADADRQGNVTINDATVIQQYLAEFTDSF